MTNRQKEINKLIWQERFKSLRGYLGIIVLFVVVLSFVLLARVPIGEPEDISVEVIAATTSQGADGSGIYLTCRLESGEEVSVFLPANTEASTGVRATIRKTELLFGGENYTFVGYQ